MKKLGVIICLVFVLGCKKDGNDGPEPNPNPQPGPGPGNPVALTISSISPDNSETGPITITGTGFTSNTIVKFGTLTATVQSASSTQLVISLPADLPQGDHDVTVANAGKTATKVKGFHLIGWFVSNFAGTGDWSQIDGPGATATFRMPMGMTVDDNGNLYVCDLNKIRKITPQGVVSTVAGGDGANYVDANGTAARFRTVTSVVRDNAGNLYVADQMNFVIRKITPTGDVTTLAGKAGEFNKTDGVGENARFSAPYGLAIDAANQNLYVGDYGNDRIRKINLATRAVTTIAGNDQQTSIDGNGIAAGIPSPGSLAFDKDGMLYITEKGGGKIRKMTPNGDVTTVGGFLSVNDSPTHLVADENNNIFVAFSGQRKIKRFTPAGVESTFAGNNTGTGEQDGPALSIFFGRPEGIVLVKDNAGKLIFYVSDAISHKIKTITKG